MSYFDEEGVETPEGIKPVVISILYRNLPKNPANAISEKPKTIKSANDERKSAHGYEKVRT